MEIQDSEVTEKCSEDERAKGVENGSEKDTEMNITTEQEKTDILHESSSTSSSSSSSQLNNKPVINYVNQISENNVSDETKFIIPILNLHTSAPTKSDLNSIPKLQSYQLVYNY
jgi:hypothetical protein